VDGRIDFVGPELHFLSVREQDSGEYECRARNSVERDLVSRIKLRVLGEYDKSLGQPSGFNKVSARAPSLSPTIRRGKLTRWLESPELLNDQRAMRLITRWSNISSISLVHTTSIGKDLKSGMSISPSHLAVANLSADDWLAEFMKALPLLASLFGSNRHFLYDAEF